MKQKRMFSKRELEHLPHGFNYFYEAPIRPAGAQQLPKFIGIDAYNTDYCQPFKFNKPISKIIKL